MSAAIGRGDGPRTSDVPARPAHDPLARRPRRRRRSGFSLLEMVATLLLLGVLAGVGAVTYATVQDNAQDRAQLASMEVFATAAMASYAFVRGEDQWTPALNTAATDVLFKDPDGWFRTPVTLLLDDPAAQGSWFAADSATISYKPATDPDTGTPVVGLSSVSPSGRCVSLIVAPTQILQSWSWGEDLGAACTGSTALEGPDHTADYQPPGGYGAPAPPTSLTATGGTGRVDLTWTPSADDSASGDVVGYIVLRNGLRINADLLPPGSTSFADTGLTDATSYEYRVKAVDTSDLRGVSSPVIGLTLPGVIAACTVSIAGRSVSLAFPPLPGVVSSYELLVDGSIADVRPAGPLTATNLDAGRTHAVAVRGVNASGPAETLSCQQDVSVVLAPDAPLWGVPATTVGDTSVTLHWQPVAGDVDGYNAYRLNAVSGLYELAGVVTASPYTVTGLPTGVTQSFTVAAYNALLEGERSTAVTARPIAAPLAATITGTTAANRSVQVDFAVVPSNARPVTGVRVHLRTGTSGAWGAPVASLPATATSHVFSGLTAGVTYSFAVVPYNNRNGEPLEAVYATTGGIVAVDTPAQVTGLAVNPTLAGDTQLVLTWDAQTSTGAVPVDGYVVERFNASSSLWEVAGTTGSAAAATYTDTGLTAGTSYQYRVFATSSVPLTGPVSATVTGTPIGRPDTATITDTAVAAGTVTLTWTHAATAARPASGIRLYTDAALTATVGAAATSYTFAGLTSGATYTFTVAPFNALGEPTPNTATTTVTAITAPGAPTGLAATVGDTSVTLAWSPVASTAAAPVTGYNVYRLNTGSGLYELAGAAASSPYTVTGLPTGVTQSFTVAAYNAVGEGERSATVTARPIAAPLAATITDTAVANRSVQVNFDVVSSDARPVTGVRVYLRTGTLGTWGAPVASLPATATSHVFAGLTAGVTYSFAVVPFNNRNGSPLEAVYATTGGIVAVAAPAQVTGLAVAPTLAGDTQLVLTWDAQTSTAAVPVDGYVVERYNESSDLWELAGTTGSAAATYTDTGLTPGTSYQYLVFAISSVPLTGPVSATVAATPIGLPNNAVLGPATYSSSAVTLTWTHAATAARPASGFRLYRDGALVATVGPSATSFTFSALAAGTSYVLAVAPYNALGEPSPITATTTVTAAVLPLAPTGLGATVGDTSVTLSWSPVASTAEAPVTGYAVYRLNTGSGLYEVLGLTDSATATYLDAGLASGTAYSYQVAASNSVGEGERSATVTGTPVTAPAAATITDALRGDRLVLVTFTATASAGAPVTGVNVYRRVGTSGTWGSPVTSLAAGATSYTFSGLTAGVTYSFAVVPFNNRNGSPLEAVYATTGGIVAVAAPAQVTGLAVAPTLAGDTQLVLTWDAQTSTGAVPVTGYNVYRLNAGTGLYELAASTTGATTATYTDTGLTAGTAYSYQVTAVGTENEGSRSSTVTGTPIGRPTTATITDTAVAAGTVTLTWTQTATAARPASGIRLYTDAALATTVGAGVTSYTFAGLTPGTSYTFTVAPFNALGEPSPNTATATVAVITTPAAAPTGLGATVGDTSVTLAWTAVAGTAAAPVTGYNVYRLNTGTGTYELRAFTTAPTVTYTDTGLTPGTTYSYQVAAYNAVGEGSRSTTVTGTPITAPAAAVIGSTSRASGTVTVTFTSASSPGAPVLGINVYRRVGTSGAWGSPVTSLAASATSYTFSGLTAGTTYSFAVVPYNNRNGSPLEAAYATTGGIVAVNTPAQVTGLAVNPTLAGDTLLVLTWTAQTSTGAVPVDGYTVERYNASSSLWEIAGTTGSAGTATYTDTGLTPGTSYQYRVFATSSVPLTGPVSATVAGTPIGRPTTATITDTSVAAGSVTLTWTHTATAARPASGIRLYTDAALTTTVGAGVTSYTFAGLTNGATYTFTVAPYNALGEPSPNTATTTVTAITTPSTPTALGATPGNAQVSLSWTAPASTGGSSITDYVIEYSSTSASTGFAVFTDGTNTSTSATVTGLTNGTQYWFRVSAVNAAGTSAPSSVATATPFTVPGTPTALGATPGNTQVSLSWTAPASTGGSAITDYVVQYSTASATGPWTTFTDGTSTTNAATVTGLTNGTQYWFQVAAVNAAGTGAYSSTATATPRTVPGAPTALAATAGNAQVALSWTAPASTGGSAIADYVVQYSSTSATGPWTTFTDGTSTSTSAAVTGLTNGTGYWFQVAAVNAAGTGAYSSTATATPRTVPGTPTALAATAGNAQVSLSWTAPASTGGSAITDYVVQYAEVSATGPWTVFADGTSTSTSATVTTLVNGTGYWFQVAAVNAAGTGAYTTAVAATPVTVPGAPTGLGATPASSQVALVWTAPVSTGGSAITDYVVQYSSASATGPWTTFTDGTSTTNAATVTGLTNGTGYWFQVAAVNAAGTGAYSSTATATPVGGPLTISVFATTTKSTSGASMPLPAGTQSGDIAVYFDGGGTAFGSTPPTYVLPTGFTEIFNNSIVGSVAALRAVASYKVLTAADITTGSITGMAPGTVRKQIRILRPSRPVTSVTVSTPTTQATAGDPAAQTIAMSGVATPVVGFAWGAAASAFNTTITVTANPAVLTLTRNTPVQHIGEVVYNSGPVNVIVDANDAGDNIFSSWYMRFD